MQTIPLFPLHTVLFPGFPLALHIFEPRYRAMISECMASSSPFGVVLIREGREVGEAAEPFSVGTLATISEVEQLDDGRYHLIAVGTKRFRCLEILPPDPYISARVELIPDDNMSALMTRNKFLPWANEYVALMTGVADTLSPANLPESADTLSWLLATLLQIPMREKQTLLEIDGSKERLDALTALYHRELEVVRLVAKLSRDTHVRPVDTDRPAQPPSSN